MQKQIKGVKSACKYWHDNIERAKEGYEMIVAIIVAVLFAAGAVLKSISPDTAIFEAFTARALGNATLWIGGIISFWAIFWLPFKRHEAQEKSHKEREDHLVKDCAKAIMDLNEKLEKFENKDAAKMTLALCLLKLQARGRTAREISRFSFSEDVMKKEWEETNGIFDSVENEIIKTLSHAEAIIFRGVKPDPLPSPEKYDTFTESFQQWQWHVNYVTAKYEELKKIVERL